jgi:hypothetical protein
MNIHTIEMNFDYQVKQIIKKAYKEKVESDKQYQSLEDWLYNNPEIISELFIEAAFQYGELDKAIEDIEE